MTSPVTLDQAGQNFYAPAFELTLRNAPAPLDVLRDVIEVTYEDHIDKVDAFSLVVNGWDSNLARPRYFGMKTPPAAASLAANRALLFRPNSGLELSMGYRGTPPDMRLMVKGRITGVELELGDAAPRILVRGLNVLDLFRTRQYTWAWPEEPASPYATVRDSDVAELLSRKPDDKSGRPGLDFPVRTDREARKAEPQLDHIMMFNQYPIVFLMERARALGYDLLLEQEPGTPAGVPGAPTKPGGRLYFGPPEAVRYQTYQLEWGRSLVSLKVNVATANQLKKVTVLGWDRKAKKPIKAEATFDTLAKLRDVIDPALRAMAEEAGREEVVTDPPVYTQKAADERAANILRAQQRELVTVTGATVGLPDLRAGRRVKLCNVDHELDGWYFVTATTHVINDSGYRTTFQARHEGRAT